MLGRFLAPRNGDDAGAGDFDQADFAHQLDELVDLLGAAGHLEHEARGRRIDHARAIDVGEAQRLDPVIAGARDLDQRQLALDVRRPAR